jgi:hypothetical protein
VASSKTLPIEIRCGETFWILLSYTDEDDTPIAITNPKLEVRVAADSTADLIYTSEGDTPDITIENPEAHQVRFVFSSDLTKNQTTKSGYWDCYATDSLGASVCLSVGVQPFKQTANVTEL